MIRVTMLNEGGVLAFEEVRNATEAGEAAKRMIDDAFGMLMPGDRIVLSGEEEEAE